MQLQLSVVANAHGAVLAQLLHMHAAANKTTRHVVAFMLYLISTVFLDQQHITASHTNAYLQPRRNRSAAT